MEKYSNDCFYISLKYMQIKLSQLCSIGNSKIHANLKCGKCAVLETKC